MFRYFINLDFACIEQLICIMILLFLVICFNEFKTKRYSILYAQVVFYLFIWFFKSRGQADEKLVSMDDLSKL